MFKWYVKINIMKIMISGDLNKRENLFINYIDEDVRKYPSIYSNVSFDSIFIMAKNKFTSISLESREFFENKSKRLKDRVNYADKMINPANDCETEIRRKLKHIERRLRLLAKASNLSVNEREVITKSKEILGDWDLIPQKDREILGEQMERFLNSNFSANELQSIYRSAIPSLENSLCIIAEKCGIKKKMNDMGDAINSLVQNDCLTKTAMNILRYIHKPSRDIATHGDEFPISGLKYLCYSLFESIQFIRDSIKKKKGI